VKLQLQGKESMDQYRETRTGFTVGEEQLRDEREASSRHTLQLLNISVVALPFTWRHFCWGAQTTSEFGSSL
jgi:hypothetical protein